MCVIEQSNSKKICQRKWKSLTEEVNSFEKIFSKQVTKAFFTRSPVEHLSKAFKHPGSIVSKQTIF